MPVVGNRIKVTSSSTGTGNITLGSAENGFQTFASGGISNNDVVRYVITEGSSWEIGKGTYLTSGPTLVRTSANLLESSTGSLLNLGGSATVFVSLADVDVMQTDGGTFTGDVTFGDNNKAIFGTGSDLQIFHDGTNSYIKDTGTGVITIQSNQVRIQNAAGTEDVAFFNQDGDVKLYYDSSVKLATTSTGVDVTGNITVSGTVDGRDVATDGTKLDTVATSATANPNAIDNVVEDTTPQLGGDLASNGNDILFADNDKAIFGAGSDLQIYHTGVASYITDQGDGNLVLGGDSAILLQNSAHNANMLDAYNGGRVGLYHSNSLKLATTATGIDVTGNATFADNGKAIFGAGSDLQIYHNGVDSFIDEVNASGWLYIRGNDVVIGKYTGETYVKGIADGAVELYYDNASKLATTSTGVSVTGTVTATSFSGDGSGLTGIIPSGTVMLFAQTAAPTGWTKITTHDNKALRLVSGTASSGGTVAFTTAFTSRTTSSTTQGGSISNTTAGGTVGSTTLTTNQIPSHNHQAATYTTVVGWSGDSPGRVFSNNLNYQGGGSVNTGNRGGGGSHNHSFSGSAHNHTFTGSSHSHTLDMAVQYVDVILASKD